jgi:hypothetical protein
VFLIWEIQVLLEMIGINNIKRNSNVMVKKVPFKTYLKEYLYLIREL